MQRWQYPRLAEPFEPIGSTPEDGGDLSVSLAAPYRLQYSVRSEPPPAAVQAPAEDVTVDKWWQPASERLHARRPTHTGHSVSITEPSLFIEPALESWHRQQSEPVRVRPLLRTSTWHERPLESSLVAPPALSWKGSQPDRAPGHRPRPQGGAVFGASPGDFPAPAGAEQFPDRWWRQPSEPRRNPLPVRGLGGGLLPPRTDGEVILPDKWYRPALEPVRPRRVRIEGGGIVPPRVVEFVYAWMPRSADPVRLVLRRPAGVVVIPPEMPGTVHPVAGWLVQQPTPARARLRLPQPLIGFESWQLFVVPETISVDKWWQPTQTPPKTHPPRWVGVWMLAPNADVFTGMPQPKAITFTGQADVWTFTGQADLFGFTGQADEFDFTGSP